MRAISVIAMLMLAVAHARADAPERVVVVADDAAFKAALADALSATATVTIATDTAPSLADIAQVSRDVCDREHATAMVWLVSAGGGSTLVAYDRTADRVLVRSLPYAGALTAPQAAEAARTTRTMLRALRVPDDDTPPPPRPPPPRPPPVIVAPIAPATPPQTLAIVVDGGVRVRAAGDEPAVAGALGVIWRPDAIGIVVAARLAPTAEVPAIMGRVSDNSIAASLRGALALGRRVNMAADAGVALHRLALDGTLAGEPVRDRRLDPAVRLGISATYTITPTIGLGVGVSADALLQRQAYASGSTEVLTVPRIQGAATVTVIARIL